MPTYLQITDIGGGVIEVVYNDASPVVKSKLFRKSNFWNVDLSKDLSEVVVTGNLTIFLHYETISKIGAFEPPASNQDVYDALKIMMST